MIAEAEVDLYDPKNLARVRIITEALVGASRYEGSVILTNLACNLLLDCRGMTRHVAVAGFAEIFDSVSAARAAGKEPMATAKPFDADGRQPTGSEREAMLKVNRALYSLSPADGMQVLANVLCRAAIAVGCAPAVILEMVGKVYEGLVIGMAAERGGQA